MRELSDKAALYSVLESEWTEHPLYMETVITRMPDKKKSPMVSWMN